jgi:hypothetical protein
MLTYRLNRELKAVLQRFLDIVGTENSKRAYHLEILLSKHKDIGICPEKDTEVTHEPGDTSAWFTLSIDNLKGAVFRLNDLRNRKMSDKMGGNAYRTCSRTSATVRSRECLMEIEMKHIESHVTRTYYSHQRVHVGSIIIQQTSTLVYKCSNLLDILFKETESVRVGHHDAGNRIVKQRLEVLDIHQTVSF